MILPDNELVVRVKDLRHAGIGTCDRAQDWADRNGMPFSELRAGEVTVARLLKARDGTATADSAYLDRLIKTTRERYGRQ